MPNSRTRRTMSWVYCPPKSTTSTVWWVIHCCTRESIAAAVVDPRPKQLRRAPRLPGAAVRILRRVAVVHLGNAAETELGEHRLRVLQNSLGLLLVARHPHQRGNVRPQQPGPSRPLVVRGVHLLDRADVPAAIAGLGTPEGSQADGC